MLSFSPLKRSFTKLAALNESRHSHATCELDGKLYVFGGLTKLGNYVKSVERIDLVAQESEWTKFIPTFYSNIRKPFKHHPLQATNPLACPIGGGIIMVLRGD